jgi:hypothetical protein
MIELEKWVKFLHDSARVVFIVVNTPAEAFMVFETLNDRGLDLTVADLTKNYLLMTASQHKDPASSERNLNQSIDYWDKMATTLATASDSAEMTKVYIHHLWASHNGVTRDKELFKDLRDRYDSPAKSLEFTRLLCDSSPLYAALGNSDSDFWTDRNTRRHLAILNTNLKATQVRMLLLAAVEHFKQAEYEEIIRCALWWSVRFLVAGGTPSKWESHYASRAKAIRGDGYPNAQALIDDMAKVVPSNDQFKAAFAEFSGGKAVTRYLLNCLEYAKLGEASPHLAADDPTLADREHILPENPDPSSWPHMTREDHERLKDRLGNHALLTPQENKNRKNGSFANAQPVYAASSFKTTNMLGLVSGEWNEQEIDKRQQEFAELAVEIWPLKPVAKKKRGS